MDHAELFISRKWILRAAKECGEADRAYPCRCPECKRPAVLCICTDKANYYRSDKHAAGCSLARGGRKINSTVDEVILLQAILDAKDKPYSAKAIGKDDGDAQSTKLKDDSDDEPVDNMTIDKITNIKTCSRAYRKIKTMALTDHITPELTVADVIVDDTTICDARINGLSGPRMMIGTLFDLPGMDPPLPPRGEYIYLRDPYTWDDKDAIYYMVRFADPTQDRIFRDTIFAAAMPID